MKNTDSIGTRMMSMRKKMGLSQAEVCKAGGFHKASYSNWENDRRTPSLIDAKTLESILNTSASYILKLSDFPEVLGEDAYGTIIAPYPSIPVLSNSHLKGNIENKQLTIALPIFNNDNKKNYFAYKIEDDSMSPEFSINDIVLLKAKQSFKHNEFVLVLLKDCESIIFRKVYIDNSNSGKTVYKLIPHNKEWPVVNIENLERISMYGVLTNNNNKIHY